jgi:hypothetical protein
MPTSLPTTQSNALSTAQSRDPGASRLRKASQEVLDIEQGLALHQEAIKAIRIVIRTLDNSQPACVMAASDDSAIAQDCCMELLTGALLGKGKRGKSRFDKIDRRLAKLKRAVAKLARRIDGTQYDGSAFKIGAADDPRQLAEANE